MSIPTASTDTIVDWARDRLSVEPFVVTRSIPVVREVSTLLGAAQFYEDDIASALNAKGCCIALPKVSGVVSFPNIVGPEGELSLVIEIHYDPHFSASSGWFTLAEVEEAVSSCLHLITPLGLGNCLYATGLDLSELDGILVDKITFKVSASLDSNIPLVTGATIAPSGITFSLSALYSGANYYWKLGGYPGLTDTLYIPSSVVTAGAGNLYVRGFKSGCRPSVITTALLD